jgi:hypothetical protein
MGRIGRSFQLVRMSHRVLLQDKELMLLPLVSGTVMAAVVFAIAAVSGIDIWRIDRYGSDAYAPVFVMYVAVYAIGSFFQAAVVAGATERLGGGDPTCGSALAAAARRAGPILMWAVFAATVGVVIRAVQDRLGLVGRLVVGLLGAAWSLATLFIVPALVLDHTSMSTSFTHSASAFKRTWGETAVGGASLGVAAQCAFVTLIAVVGLLASVIGTAALVVFGVGAILLLVFFSTLDGIFLASLYRYATEGVVPDGFDRSLLDQAFVVKGTEHR